MKNEKVGGGSSNIGAGSGGIDAGYGFINNDGMLSTGAGIGSPKRASTDQI